MSDNQEPTPVKETSASQGAVKKKIQKAGATIGKKIVSPQFILVSGLIVSGAFIVEGLLCFTLCKFNFRSYILSFYYIVFGLMTISAELQIHRLLKYFRIIESYTGKGLWYIFLGTIALGGEWWAILIALLLVFEGFLNLIGGCNLPPRTSINDNTQERQKLAAHTDNQVVLGSGPKLGSNIDKLSMANNIMNNNINNDDNEINIQLSNQNLQPGNQINSKTNPFKAYEDY